ncbi:MAG: NFACT family protein [Desulfomonile tiedjei]|nr:NFACT family protein [Desulfomonile tiedjei]
MDLAVLQKVAQELNEVLVGGFVNKIHQPLPREIVLRIRSRENGENKLMISADPLLGRIHLTGLRIPNPPAPPRFCAFLRAHFQGSRIREVRADSGDRVVRIVATRGPEAERVCRELIVELLGRDSNIILVDGDSQEIMDCLHRIPDKETGSRVVMPGWVYLPPQKRPQAARRGNGESEVLEGLPGIRTRADGKRRLVLNATEPGDEQYATMNLAAEALYAPRLESLLVEALRREVAAPCKARIRSLERREEKIRSDAERLKRLVDRQEEGELLKANLNRVKKGMRWLEAEDWTTGGKRTIELDPALDAVANMQRIFRKAAKGKRGEKKVQERLQVTRDEKRAIEELLYFVEEARDVTELESAATSIPGQAGDTRNGGPQPKRIAPTEPSLFHVFHTDRGRPVLVGKSAAGNDFLLRHKAHKGDRWLHVKDFAGAHVILSAKGLEPPSFDETRYAAGLAAHFSKARGKGKVEVIVADVADVHRIKGAMKGQVSVKHYLTILAEGSRPKD